MRATRTVLPRLAPAWISALVWLASAQAADVRIMISGGYTGALLALAPEFERTTGHKLIQISGASMGDTPQAIPNRLLRGEAADIFITADNALDSLISNSRARGDTRADLAQSGIGMAVRAGAPPSDISSVNELRRTLLTAKSIAYSNSASGVYLSTVRFPRLGIDSDVRGKSRTIAAEPVGNVVARGDAEIGFQQMSELKRAKGIDLVGPLPAGAQKMTVFSAAVASNAREADAARALIQYLSSPAARQAVIDSDMEPIAGK